MPELTIERMALNAAAAIRCGDERTAAYWTEAVEVASLRQDVSVWDELKGSPEHG